MVVMAPSSGRRHHRTRTTRHAVPGCRRQRRTTKLPWRSTRRPTVVVVVQAVKPAPRHHHVRVPLLRRPPAIRSRSLTCRTPRRPPHPRASKHPLEPAGRWHPRFAHQPLPPRPRRHPRPHARQHRRRHAPRPATSSTRARWAPSTSRTPGATPAAPPRRPRATAGRRRRRRWPCGLRCCAWSRRRAASSGRRRTPPAPQRLRR